MSKKLIISQKVYEDIYHKWGQSQTVEINTDEKIVTKNAHEKYNNRDFNLWKIMQKYPQFFATIISMNVKEIKQELLDAEKFKKDLTQMANEIDTQEEKDYSSYTFDAAGRLDDIITDIYYDNENLKQFAVHLPKPLFDFYKKLRTLIQNLRKIEDANDIEFDLHSAQFGYDKQNNIKAFDI